MQQYCAKSQKVTRLIHLLSRAVFTHLASVKFGPDHQSHMLT